MSTLDTAARAGDDTAHGSGLPAADAGTTPTQRAACCPAPRDSTPRGATSSIRITIPGAPVPKGRPLFSVVGNGSTRRVRTRTPPKTEAAEAHVASCVPTGLEALAGSLRARVLFVTPRPKALRRKCDPRGFMWAPVRPDLDNYVKLLLDGLAALWRDDAQVVELVAAKVRAEIGGEPRTVVEVGPAGDVAVWARFAVGCDRPQR